MVAGTRFFAFVLLAKDLPLRMTEAWPGHEAYGMVGTLRVVAR